MSQKEIKGSKGSGSGKDRKVRNDASVDDRRGYRKGAEAITRISSQKSEELSM